MQTIDTKFHPATNHKPSRISAEASGCQVQIFISYDHSLNVDENHTKAANMLLEKLQWTGDYIGGHTKKGMVFVSMNDHSFAACRGINPEPHVIKLRGFK
jgi:hypothetical protein